MKILHLIPYNPTPPTFGGALRIYHLLKHNFENHDLTVAGFDGGFGTEKMHESFPGLDVSNLLKNNGKDYNKRLEQFKSMFSDSSHWFRKTRSENLQRILNELTDKNDFDIVLTEFPALCQFEIRSDAKKIMDAHNVEYDNLHRMYQVQKDPLKKLFYKREYRKFKEQEIYHAGIQDALFTTSERDKNIFNSHLPDMPIHLIPNGVDMDFFSPVASDIEPHSLVFTGMMGYVPNYDGILYFIQDIMPMIMKKYPDLKLYVVGKNPPASIKEKASKNIIVTGFVDDVRPYVHRSSVYIVPLRSGGGTRLKVLEALSMKKPVVSTAIGSEGIDVIHDEHLKIADDPQLFADYVIELMEDRKEAKRLSDNGYELIDKRYKWESIGHRMEEAFNAVINVGANKDRSSKETILSV
ncbi:glycosyltransferase [Balneola sp. MJW-20]|uniref:glycosyltransferase n=1 Tax=Gracilimonas aurantiaca TaxID=3234185 RepID=UPI0034679D21